jgi:PTS system mannose-specific IIC component
MSLLHTAIQAQADNQITIGFSQAALIGFGYYLSQSPWLFGLSFLTIYRPLAAGLIVGIILGEPAKGTLIGALAGWVGTTFALAGNLSYGAALALAVPIGLLGTLIINARMTGDTAFVHLADRAAERGDIRAVARCNWLWPQIYLFLITFVPVTAGVWLGTEHVTDIINNFPVWLLSGLAIAGGILPAIGIAMNMRFIFHGTAIPYFFLGYLVMVATNRSLSIVLLAGIGLALAVLHVILLGDRIAGSAGRARDRAAVSRT